MVNQAAPVGRTAIMESLFERIQDEASVCCLTGAPAYDPTGVGIDDEGDIYEPCPGRGIGEVRHPKPVRRWREELAVDVIARARCRLVADGRTHRLAPDHACQAHLMHQPFDGATGDHKALPHHLPPYLPHAVDGKVLREHASDLGLEDQIFTGSCRQTRWILSLRNVLVVGGWGDRQDTADRLDRLCQTNVASRAGG
jgi:hypothetical protein